MSHISSFTLPILLLVVSILVCPLVALPVSSLMFSQPLSAAQYIHNDVLSAINSMDGNIHSIHSSFDHQASLHGLSYTSRSTASFTPFPSSFHTPSHSHHVSVSRHMHTQAASTAAHCETYTGHVFKNMFASNNVYIPANYTQASMESSVSSLPTLLMSFSSSCRLAVANSLGAQTFMPCSVVGGVPVPQPSCVANCQKILDDCSSGEQAYLAQTVPISLTCSPAGGYATSNCNNATSNNNINLPACEAFRPNDSPSFANVIPSSHQVYVAAGYSQSELHSAIAPALALVSALSNDQCKYSFTQLLAATTYFSCSMNGPTPLIRLPCRSMCSSLATVCSAGDMSVLTSFWYVNVYGSNTQLDCASTGHTVPGNDDFPPSSTTFSAAPLTQTMCFTINTPAHCEAYQGRVFKGMITQNIYVPQGMSQSSIESQLTPLSSMFNLFSPSCRLAVSNVIAANTFPSCQTIVLDSNTGAYAAMPSFTCASLCTTMTAQCSQQELGIVGAYLSTSINLDCSAVWNNVPLSGYVQSGSCNNMPGQSGSTKTPVPVCAAFNASAVPGFANTMSPNYQVYVPAGYTQDELWSQIKQATDLLPNLSSEKCQNAFRALMATTVFMGCTVSTASGLTYPRLPCRSVCNTMYTDCSAQDMNYIGLLYATPLYGSFLNCSSVGHTISAVSDFPISTFNISLQEPPLQCQPLSSVPVTPSVSAAATYARCVPYTGTACANYIPQGSLVYMPAGRCLAQLEDQVSGFASVMLGATTACSTDTANLLCNYVYQSCDNSSFATGLSAATGGYLPRSSFPELPLPRFPARSMCTKIAASCPGVFTMVSPPPADYATNGHYLDLTADGNIANFLLAGFISPSAAVSMLTGSCDFTVNAPNTPSNPNYEFPATRTVFFTLPAFGQVITVATSVNTGLAAPQLTPPPMGSCQPFNSTLIAQQTPKMWADGSRTEEPLIDTPVSHCRRIIAEGSSVYVPGGASLAYLNLQARKAAWTFSLTPTPNGCSVAYAKHICTQIFMPCSDSVISIPYVALGGANKKLTLKSAFPQLPCHNTCTDMNSKCAAFFATSQAPNCSSRAFYPSNPLTGEIRRMGCDGQLLSGGQMDFPISSTYWADLSMPSFNLGGGVVVRAHALKAETTCNAWNDAYSTSLLAADVPYTCPPQTVDLFKADKWGRPGNPNSRYAIGSCGIGCPNNYFTENARSTSESLFVPLRAFDCFVISLYAISFIVLKRKEASVVTCMLSIMFIQSWSSYFIAFTSTGVDRELCANNSEPTTFFGTASGLCSFQALVQQSSSALLLAWAFMASEIGIKIGFQINFTKQQGRWFARSAWGFCYFWFALMMIILSDNVGLETGNSIGMPFCKNPHSARTYNVSDYTCFLVALAVAAFFLPLSTYRLFIANRRVQSTVMTNALWRTAIFTITSLLVILFSLSFLALTDPQISPKYSASFGEWIACWVGQQPYMLYTLGSSAFQCSSRPAITYTDAFYIVSNIIFSLGNSVSIMIVYRFPVKEWREYYRNNWSVGGTQYTKDASVTGSAVDTTLTKPTKQSAVASKYSVGTPQKNSRVLPLPAASPTNVMKESPTAEMAKTNTWTKELGSPESSPHVAVRIMEPTANAADASTTTRITPTNQSTTNTVNATPTIGSMQQRRDNNSTPAP